MVQRVEVADEGVRPWLMRQLDGLRDVLPLMTRRPPDDPVRGYVPAERTRASGSPR